MSTFTPESVGSNSDVISAPIRNNFNKLQFLLNAGLGDEQFADNVLSGLKLKDATVLTTKLEMAAGSATPFGLANNIAFQAKNSGGTLKDLFFLDTDNLLKFSQIYWQDQSGTGVVTNSILESLCLQFGWSYVQGDGASTAIDRTITFPVAFDDAKYVIVPVFIGTKNTAGAPTAPDQANSDPAVVNAYQTGSTARTNSAAVVRVRRTDGSNLASGHSYLFNWYAFGKKS